MITNEQVEAALKAWYDAGDAGNFASMFAALKAAELKSAARIAELEAGLDPLCNKFAWSAVTVDCEEARVHLQSLIDAARAAYKGEKE